MKMGSLRRAVMFTFLLVSTSCLLSEASKAPAFFILGDSTVDTGNQDYITSVVKSNYPPYGKDFVPPGPTGRFSNGKLVNDYVAEYLELPYPVNYLDPKATGAALLTGVNLASSGSGYLDITGSLFGVLNLTMQLVNLKKVQDNINQQIGQEKTATLFSDALYLISTGSNDFVNNYNINPVIQDQYNPDQWRNLILASIKDNLKILYNLGARKVFIDSLGPIGCTPEQLTILQSKDGKCFENVNAPLRAFNAGLRSLVVELRQEIPDYKLIYVNVYDLIWELVQNPVANGYKYGNVACCGEGPPYKGLPCANPVSDLCDNADDYVFWDLFHPSQRTYKLLTDAAIYGDQSVAYPYNLSELIAEG